MKKLKIILVTTCISFTLVVLLNTLFDVVQFTSRTLKATDIFQIFSICLMVSIGIYLATLSHFLKEHFYSVGYIVMMIVVFTMETFFRGEFAWQSFLIEFLALTVIYVIVCFLLLYENEKDADTINKKLHI